MLKFTLAHVCALLSHTVNVSVYFIHSELDNLLQTSGS